MKNKLFIGLQIFLFILSTSFFSVGISQYNKLREQLHSEITNSFMVILYVISVFQIFLYNGIIIYIIKRESRQQNKIRKGYKKWMAHICYSIRTPVHTINYISDTILKQHNSHRSPETQKIRLLSATTNQLFDIVNLYSDFTASESNNITIKTENTNLFEITNSIFEQYQIINTETLAMELDFDNLLFNKILIADPLKIRQILSTALHNSTKFTSKGKIILKVRKTTNDTIELRVTDTGRGLKGREEKIIDYKTGLGLLISKYAAEAMGGSISLKNRTDGVQGTEFKLTIPYQEYHSSPQISRILLPRMFSDIIVFACDDDSAHRYTIKDMFVSFGIEFDNIKIFSDGDEMINFMRNSKVYIPHIIFLDIFMKRMNGDELYDHIRELGYTGPIIAVTANVYNKKYLEQGFEKVLNKPYNPSQLRDIIESCLNFGIEIV